MSVAEVEPKKQSARKGIVALLEDPSRIEKIRALLPKHMDAARFMQIVFNCINKTPKLALCTPESFFESIQALAGFGLEPDNRRAYLIPYENRRKNADGKWETASYACQYQLDYKGIVELVLRHGDVSSIHADVVRDGDLLVYSKGELRDHVPWFLRRDKDRPADPGPVYAVYCVVRMKGGGEKCEVMSEDDVLAIRNESQGWKAFKSKAISDIPWNPEHPHKAYEMYKKTVFKRLSKWLPLSSEIRDAIQKEDEFEYPEYGHFEQPQANLEAKPKTADDLANLLKARNEEADLVPASKSKSKKDSDKQFYSKPNEPSPYDLMVEDIEKYGGTDWDGLQSEFETSPDYTPEQKQILRSLISARR